MINDTRVVSYFHDQSITGLIQQGTTPHINMSCYGQQDKVVPVSVAFIGVRDVVVDHVPNAEIAMVYEDGEAIEFDVTGQKAKLIIEWRSSNPPYNRLMKYYDFTFDRMEISDSAKLL